MSRACYTGKQGYFDGFCFLLCWIFSKHPKPSQLINKKYCDLFLVGKQPCFKTGIFKSHSSIIFTSRTLHSLLQIYNANKIKPLHTFWYSGNMPYWITEDWVISFILTHDFFCVGFL
jgi:hypothetical protein